MIAGRRGRFAHFVAGTIVAVGVALAPRPAAAEFAAPDTTETFLGTETPVPSYALAHRFLLLGDEVIRRDGVTQRPEVDFRLDPDAGTLALKTPLAPGERLEVSYSWLPVELPREFVGVRPVEPTPVDSTRMTPEEGEGAVEFLSRSIEEDLEIRGAKTVSIETGSNKDAAVEQSLRVSVSGQIGENVRLQALLSDQNIPLQPEGNTERLENLDEVLVRIEGPNARATLGDFPAERTGTAFGDFERRLSGAEAQVAQRGFRARGIGATSRGNFRTVEFRGQEGKQGPYVLAGDGLNPTGVVVAGSERVWLDGRTLRRGRNQDYVIDYSRGEIEFTNRTLITQDSRVAVDFEVSEQPYRRSLLLGEGGYENVGRGFAWQTAIISEIDDDDPLNFTLTDDRRQALEEALDGPVLVSGIECDVEDGDYDMVDDHFVFAGVDSGSCNVAFVFVGENQGDYLRQRDADRGVLFFEFVGAGLGSYTTGLLLDAPRAHTIADTRLAWRGAGFEVAADGAFSREDRNTFSSLAEVREGAAGNVRLGWESPRLGDLGGDVKLRSTARYRGEEAEFESLGRNRRAWLGEVWNFTDTTRVGEGLGEATVALGAEGRWKTEATYGRLERIGRFESQRRQGLAEYTGRRLSLVRYSIERVDREDQADSAGTVDGDLLRQRGVVRWKAGWFEPQLNYYREDRNDARGGDLLTGRDEEELGGGLLARPTRGVEFDVRYANRTTDVVDSARWVRDNIGETWEARATVEPRRGLRARFSWIQRDVDFEAGRSGTDSRSVLTRSDLSHENFSGFLRGEYVYETTSRTFTNLLASPDDPATPTLALDTSARLRLGGRGRGRSSESGGDFLYRSLWRAETLIQIEEESTRPDRGALYRLDFSKLQDDEYTVFGRILTRQEVTLFPGAGPVQVTGRWERIDTEDNRALPQRLDILTERFVLRARNRLKPRWNLESQGTVQDEFRSDDAVSEFDVRLLQLQSELVYQPRPSTRLAAGATFADETNEVTDAGIRGFTVRTSLQSAVWQSGRLQSEVSWTRPFDVRGLDTSNRFQTRDENQVDWRASLDLRLNDWVNVSTSYSGRYLRGVPTTHLARAEARALF